MKRRQFIKLSGSALAAEAVAAFVPSQATEQSAAVVAPAGAQESAVRLWEQEPALWDAAQKYHIARPLAPVYGWEGPCGMKVGNKVNHTPGPDFTGPSGEGVNLCNERLQSAVWGPPDRIAFSLGKTDVFNRAGLSFFRGKKPVGQLLLMAEDFAGAPTPTVTTSIHNGNHQLRLKQGEAAADIQFLLTRSDTNVIAIKADYANLAKPCAVRLYRHCDKFKELPEPEGGSDGAYFWIRQAFAAEKTFPQGFDYYLMAKIAGAPAAELTNMQPGLGAAVPFRPDATPGSAATVRFPAAASRSVVVYVTVVTRAETADPLAEAKRRLDAAESQGYEGLLAANAAWYRNLYSRREQGRIFTGNIDDAKSVFLPFFYHGSFQSRHTFNSNPDPTKYEGDAAYNNLESDEVFWSGLQCFNEELYTGDYVAGRDETVATYYVKLFNFWRKAWQDHARKAGQQGLLILRGYVPPIKNDVYWSPDAPAMNGCDWASMVWAFKCVWDAFDYGGHDIAFLRDSVYPCLSDLADFFAGKVKLGKDGYYHLEPSQIREEDAGRDAIDCMAAARWAFRRAVEASQLLDVDADNRKTWQDRLSKMMPRYVIQNEKGEPIFASLVKNGTPVVAGHGVAHFLVNVADEINLESPEEDKQTAIRSNHVHYEQPMNRQVEFLLGQSPDRLFGTSVFGHPEWMIFYAQKTGIANFAAHIRLETREQKAIACWLEPERLCNSRSGTIFFFPCAPSGFDVAFRDFQARGGFLVSAERRGGKVSYAQIKARRSGTCALMNPWPGQMLRILKQADGAAVSATRSGEKYQFEAAAGTSYALVPGEE